ncbi:hypothetical protein [Streptomyces sp. MP131-18]|uniref:hypothetical protein n=1 Tax=Streptomyces sp. MP131-18 TaxID=1857892 RepID=UPI00097C2B4C|nr:hypothetical protein [Streptomyces sp. MP131-18]
MKTNQRAGEWTIVHQRRQEIRSGQFEGIFLGNDRDRWMAGRMYTGTSRRDGFSPTGEWWYSTYCDQKNATENMREARAAYLRLSHTAEVSDSLFEQRAGEAIDRHLAGLVSLDGVHDLSAGWHVTDYRPPLDPVGGNTYLLPAQEAKYELLVYLRRTESSAGLAMMPPGMTLTLHEAYQKVIRATGPITFELGRYTYSLVHQGSYCDIGRFPRNPHPERGAGR